MTFDGAHDAVLHVDLDGSRAVTLDKITQRVDRRLQAAFVDLFHYGFCGLGAGASRPTECGA